jgi:two-component system phosphate regulon sensor histidine kinase PhoR
MFWRLFLTIAALLLSAIGLMGVVIVNRVEQQFLQQIKDSLLDKVILVRKWVNSLGPDAPAQTAALGKEIRARITLIDGDGKVLVDSHADPRRMDNHGRRPEVLAACENRMAAETRFSDTLGLWMMYAAVTTNDARGKTLVVRVALELDNILEQVGVLRGIVWTAATITALAAMALAFWLARRVTMPLQELTAGAELIASGQYGKRVYVTGSDEVGILARAFNHMSSRLAAQFTQLDEDRQQLRAILGGMIEGVVALDAEQHILFVNDHAARLLEFVAPAVVGRRFWEVVRQPAIQEIVQRALNDSEPYEKELNLAGLTTKSLTVHAARLGGPPNRGIILVLHDTTQLRRLEGVRQEFVANVSHELKTPLSVIKACVETLLDGAAEDAQHRGPFLERIGEQAERLHNLILDLLSLARIESESAVFEFERVPVGPVVRACLQRHQGLAEGKNQLLVASCAGQEVPWDKNGQATLPGVEISVWADAEAVAQILDNLVDNAVKYTPAGGRISVAWHAESGRVCLEVEDTGIGIAEADLPRVFERFYRVDRARSREMGGTGLGLAIVKHLVQAMHGTVRIISEPTQGSRFSIWLPCPAGS